MPESWEESHVRKAFEPFGRISSLFLQKNAIGTFAFICYGSEKESDREYGPKCANAAVQAMHEREIDGKKLYVTEAKKKEQRKTQLEQETQKYKNSKKRCNLFVKNFDASTTEEDLRNLFIEYGEIESLRLFQQKDGKSPYAFVCFKTPDAASSCKNANLGLNGKPIYINHYEMKQTRDIQNEAAKDKKDWQRYQSENATLPENFQNFEQIQVLLRLLMGQIQNKNINMPPQGHMGNSRPQGPMQHNNYGNQGGNRNYGNRQGGNQPHYQGGNPRMQHSGMPQPGMPQPMPHAGMPQPSGMQGMPGPQVTPSNDPNANGFYSKTMPIYAAITEINPNYKNTVGGAIFQFVTQIVGQDFGPKVTGMLIDLPIAEIQKFVTNYDLFQQRVQQAQQLLVQQK